MRDDDRKQPGAGVGIEGNGERWREAMPALADKLREFGYDIEPTQHGVPLSSNLVARRDLEDRAVVIAIAAGGRFRATISLAWM